MERCCESCGRVCGGCAQVHLETNCMQTIISRAKSWHRFLVLSKTPIENIRQIQVHRHGRTMHRAIL